MAKRTFPGLNYKVIPCHDNVKRITVLAADV